MRFSVYLNAQTRGPEMDAANVAALTEQALTADARGFAGIFLTEHHFNNYNTFCDPFVYGAYLAPQLKQAHLGMAVAVPHLYHPFRLAEECNLLDLLTGGKLILGVGIGSSTHEYHGFGIDPDAKRDAFESSLEWMTKAWAHKMGDPPLVIDSPYWKGSLEGRIMPASARQPHPFIARASVSDESVALSARRGWGVYLGRFSPERAGAQMALYKKTLAESGHPPEVMQQCLDWSGMLKMVYVADTDEQALDLIQEPAEGYWRAQELANTAIDQVQVMKVIAGPRAMTLEARIERTMIYGSPDTVARQLQEYGDAGIDHMMLWFLWGYNKPEPVRRSLELFVNEVMPRFT